MTREKIISAALDLFVKKGLAGTSIREISSAASTNLSSINYYFKSKKGLYKACIDQFFKISFDLSKHTLVEAKCVSDIQPSLLNFTNEIFSFYLSHSNLLLLALQETEKREISDFPNIENIFNDLNNYFESLLEKKFIDKECDPFVLASMFLGLISQAIRYDEQRKKRLGTNIKEDQIFREQYSKHIAITFYRGIINK